MMHIRIRLYVVALKMDKPPDYYNTSDTREFDPDLGL